MFTRLLLTLLLGYAGAQPPGPSAKRWALVIGNDDYRSLPAVPAAAQDAELMSQALKGAGFRVDSVRNLTYSDFFAKENEFLKRVSAGDICFVYYSGYAVQGDLEDDNYLLPVNFEPQSQKPMEGRAYHLERLQTGLENRHAALKMFVLEGSRAINTPIAGAGRGLMEPHISYSTETLFWFSASPGQTVNQAPRAHGRFTEAAARYMSEPGLRLSEIFEKIKRQVGRVAEFPYVIDNVTQDFYFHAPLPVKVDDAKPPKRERPAGFSATNKIDRLEYVWIPAGKEFKMGCVPTDAKCEPHEKPQHAVTISKGFWLGRTEVEAGAYQRFFEEQGKKAKMRKPTPALWDQTRGKQTNYPIVDVSWEEAKNYCDWIGGRLPTEAEWEYAARAGEAGQIYPLNDENSRDKANFVGRQGNDHYDYGAPVRSFDANAYELYDMAGNVWEWVNDFYSPAYYKESPSVDPKGPAAGKEHVIRGGSFDSDPRQHLRLSFRRGFGKSGNALGFRCAMDDTAGTHKTLKLQDPDNKAR